MNLDARAIAQALGGDVQGRDAVLVPGPGHSPKDRSLSVKLVAVAADGFVVHSHAGDDPIQCRDYVRSRLGLPLWRPNSRTLQPLRRAVAARANGANGHHANGSNGHHATPLVHELPDSDAIKLPTVALPARTPPDTEGRPRFMSWGDDGPPVRDEQRRHVYKRDGMSVRIKIKNPAGAPLAFTNWYRVADDAGAIGWQAKKPDGYLPVPYVGTCNPFDPELIADRVYWPEGEKDVDRVTAAGGVALAFGGVGDGLPEGVEQFLAGRDLIILSDNDDPGRKHAARKIEIALPVAKSVRLVEFSELPPGGDVSDWFEGGGTIDALHARADAAEIALPDDGQLIPAGNKQSNIPNGNFTLHGQIPLVAEFAASESYPVQALGPILSRGALAIARKIQAPVAMAAQSVLAVAALAAQAHADVQLSYGQSRPLSLALITVASSGDRKTSTDREASWPLRTHEQELGATYSYDLESYRIRAAVWEAEKKKIETDKKATRDARKIMLEDLGPAPVAPLFPFLTAPEPTIEGLIKAMPRALGSLGLFSAEGGQFVGGHGMSTDNRLKTAAALSNMWDGDTIKRIRAGDGVSIIKGRRLSLHMMIQPDVAAVFLTDPLLRDQGLLSRILVAAPCSMAGTRTYQETAAADESAIREYGGHILRLLRKPWPLASGTDNELTPRALVLSVDAVSLWRDFYDETERQLGSGGRLAPVRDFAGKAAEHAARVAGVLTIVADADAVEIVAGEMRDAVELVRWHLGEALRLCAASMTDPATRHAVKLLDWLRANYADGSPFGLREIVRLGPAELRSKSTAESAMRKVADHGYAREHSPKPLKWALVPAGGDA